MRLACCILTWTVLIGAAAGDEKDSVANDPKLRARVEGLIAQLGAESFDEREAAEKKLYALGDRLLFEPELGDDADLSVLEQFHHCFILPLHAARQDKNLEMRQRANKVFSEFSPDRPIGKGVSGWALYGAYRLMPQIPQPVKDEEIWRKKLPQDQHDEQMYVNQQRRFARQRLENLMIANMARDDPVATGEWMLKDRLNRTPAVWWGEILLRVWGSRDFEATLAWWQRVHKRFGYDVSTHTIDELFSVWPEDRSIDEVVKWLKDNPLNRLYRFRSYWIIMTRWAAQDPKEAIQWVKTTVLPSQDKDIRSRRKSSVTALIRGIASVDFQRAKALVTDFNDADLRDEAQLSLIRYMCTHDMEVREADIDAIKDPHQRQSAWWGKVQHMASRDVHAAIAKLPKAEPPGTNNWQLRMQIAEQWYRKSPKAALEWLDLPENNIARDHCLRSLAQRESKKNLSKAFELLNGIRSVNLQREMEQWRAHALSRTNPQKAMVLYLENKDRRYSVASNRLNLLLKSCAVADPTFASEWVTEREASEQFTLRCRAIAAGWVTTDREKAVRWAIGHKQLEVTALSYLGLAEGILADEVHNSR